MPDSCQSRVSKDIRLVGFDNVRFASLLSTLLTTVEQPVRDIAITAFSALRERMTNSTLPPRTLILTPRLVVRENCGAYLQPYNQVVATSIVLISIHIFAPHSVVSKYSNSFIQRPRDTSNSVGRPGVSFEARLP